MTTMSPFQEVDARWLGEALRTGGHADAAVTDIEVELLPRQGATTVIARLHVAYAEAARPGPASMIAKFRGKAPEAQQVDAALGLFDRELHFYAELAGSVPVRVPRALALGDGVRNPLVLEDLLGLRAGDQAAGFTVADAERTLDGLADLHAAFWEASALKARWLCRLDNPVYNTMISQLQLSGLPIFRQRYADALPDEVVAGLSRISERWQEITERFSQGPRTLMHNDCRLDNLFFADDGAPILLDWQTVAAAHGLQDVGNLLAASLSSEDLSEHWQRLLRRYHDRLCERGVTGYSFDQCIQHYRQHVACAFATGLAMIGSLEHADGRGAGGRALERAIPHMIELDSFSALESP
jgi:aminoglycoside/choline kinase family phosphotransferase